jgi:hypothetical protein
LKQAVLVYAAMNPQATVADWVSFASRFSAEAYKSGYMRGLEWNQRARGNMDPTTDLKLLEADARRHEWNWVELSPAEQDMGKVVEQHGNSLSGLSPEDRALHLDFIGRHMGNAQVKVVPATGAKDR